MLQRCNAKAKGSNVFGGSVQSTLCVRSYVRRIYEHKEHKGRTQRTQKPTTPTNVQECRVATLRLALDRSF